MRTLPFIIAFVAAFTSLPVNAQDPEVLDALAEVLSGPSANPRPRNGSLSWIRLKDYPVEAWRGDMEGYVEYDVAVDRDGKPTQCNVTLSSGHAALDAATCKLVSERARFYPATNAESERIEGRFSGAYYWQKREPDLAGSYAVTVGFTVDEDGKHANCEIIEITGELPESHQRRFENDTCPQSITGASGAPFRDEEGAPVAKRVTLRVTVELSDFNPETGD